MPNYSPLFKNRGMGIVSPVFLYVPRFFYNNSLWRFNFLPEFYTN